MYFLFLIINLCSITTGEKQCVPVRDHTRSVFVHVGNTKPLAPWENKKYHCSNLFNYLLVHRFEESSHFLLRLCKNTAAVPRICVWIFSFLFFVFLVQQTHFVSAHSSFVMEEAVRRRYILCVCILITDQQNDLMRQSSKPPRASLSSSCKYVGVVTWVYLYWFRFLEDDVIVQRAGLSNVSGQVSSYDEVDVGSYGFESLTWTALHLSRCSPLGIALNHIIRNVIPLCLRLPWIYLRWFKLVARVFIVQRLLFVVRC